jgi:methylated-DNA-protein-cysteine methyltransferase-like protein
MPVLCCLLFIVDNRQRGPGAASQQADALRREGVEVRQDAMGQYTINLAEYGWFPDVLPSESGLVESSDEEDEEAAAYHT